MIKIAVNGALGRMGSRILTLALQSKDIRVSAAFDRRECGGFGKDIGPLLGLEQTTGVKLTELSAKSLGASDVLIDFSSPEGTEKSIAAAVAAKKAIAIGTTGHGQPVQAKIREAAKTIPVLLSPNMSIGANFLFEIARLAAARLEQGYDIEIIEAHHRLKKDAPSGTAKKIAEIIADEKGWDLDKASRYGRKGMTGERTREEIGIHVVRAGDIVGEHTVIFSGPGETIELTHRAQSRDAFARGALVAALFLAKKSKGLYQMSDVLK